LDREPFRDGVIGPNVSNSRCNVGLLDTARLLDTAVSDNSNAVRGILQLPKGVVEFLNVYVSVFIGRGKREVVMISLQTWCLS